MTVAYILGWDKLLLRISMALHQANTVWGGEMIASHHLVKDGEVVGRNFGGFVLVPGNFFFFCSAPSSSSQAALVPDIVGCHCHFSCWLSLRCALVDVAADDAAQVNRGHRGAIGGPLATTGIILGRLAATSNGYIMWGRNQIMME